MKSYKPYLSYKKDLDKGKISLADVIKDNCPYDDLTDGQQAKWIFAYLNDELDENGKWILEDKFIESEEAADIIFNLIPEDIQKKYEEKILGKTLTLKDKFMNHWNENGFEYTKYKRKSDLERMILYCWSEYWDKYGIYVFDDLFV